MAEAIATGMLDYGMLSSAAFGKVYQLIAVEIRVYSKGELIRLQHNDPSCWPLSASYGDDLLLRTSHIQFKAATAHLSCL